MRTPLIIPAFNEAGSIQEVIQAARPHVDGDVVVIGHGPEDDTAALARAAGAAVLRPHWTAPILGVAYPPSLLFGLAFLFVLPIMLHDSLVISSHRDSIRRLAQTVALLGRQIEEQQEGAEVGR